MAERENESCGLFMVFYDDDDGGDWEAVVLAGSLQEAVELWRGYVPQMGEQDNRELEPQVVRRVLPDITVPGPARVLQWGGPELPVVYDSAHTIPGEMVLTPGILVY